MGRDAESALEGLSPTSPYRSAMLHAIGAAHLLGRDPDAADLYFVRAVDEATSAGTLPFLPLLLTERGIIATEREAWAEADSAGASRAHDDERRAIRQLLDERARLRVVRPRRARRGDLTKPATSRRVPLAFAHFSRTHSPWCPSKRSSSWPVPISRSPTPEEPARVLGQANDILQHRPDLGTLPDQVTDLRSRLESLKAEMVGTSALTTAEFRLLPLLLDPPHARGDRRSPVRVARDSEGPNDLGVPEARRLDSR